MSEVKEKKTKKVAPKEEKSVKKVKKEVVKEEITTKKVAKKTETKPKTTRTKKEEVLPVVKETKAKRVKKEEEIDNLKETKPKKSVKKETASLSSKDQHNYGALCKALRVITKIGRVCLMIFVPFIFIFLLIVPIVFQKVEISPNEIKINEVSIMLEKESISFKIGDDIQTYYVNAEDINRVTTFLEKNSAGKIALLLETFILMLGVVVVLDIYLLSYLEKLFSNFEKDAIPFTDENTNYVLKSCKTLLAIKIIVLCMSILELFSFDVTSISVIEILIAFVIYYLFKYATIMQKNSDIKIYN